MEDGLQEECGGSFGVGQRSPRLLRAGLSGRFC